MIAYLFWDPRREMIPFDLPILGRPILWYGFFFALGFFLGYYVLLSVLKKNPSVGKHSKAVAEKATFYVIVGVIIGARLGDFFFYQKWPDTLRDPWAIFKIWEGGLASHGGAAGILAAIFLLSLRLKPQFPKLTFLSLLDLVVIPTGLVAAFIRIGNFFNQEILGKPTSLPWAVLFGHPADGSRPIPRHPVQLYEAFFYLSLFCLTYMAWQKIPTLRRKGKMVGLFLILTFTFRFLIEFIKEEQSVWLGASSFLTMGQLLSLPFIGLGFIFLFYKKTETNS